MVCSLHFYCHVKQGLCIYQASVRPSVCLSVGKENSYRSIAARRTAARRAAATLPAYVVAERRLVSSLLPTTEFSFLSATPLVLSS